MKLRVVLLVSLILVVSCRVVLRLEPTAPLPGWRSPVGELLLEDDAFPEGWVLMRETSSDRLADPTVNSVYRSWWKPGSSEGAEQVISRAYTVAEAQDLYTELRQRQFSPRGTLPPYELFVEFQPPDGIDFQSEVADEFYLACGWWTWAYCKAIARYQNYVVELRLDWETEYEGNTAYGLTEAEVESVVRAMDAKFAEAMETLYPSPP